MEEQLQGHVEQFIGNYAWLFITGFLFLLFKTTIESLVEAVKVYVGDD